MPQTNIRKYATAMIAVGALALTACSGSSGGDSTDGDVRTLRLSHFMETSHPIEACGMEALRNHLDGSTLQVETYPAAQLGGETESLEQVFSGNLDMSINGPSFIGVYYEPFNVLDAGYLFENAEALRDLGDSDAVLGVLEGAQEASGMKVFPGWYYGTRHITANTPVESPDDLKNLKLRTPDAPLYKTNITSMGGNPTPMALDELYLALQQGAVDAQENPFPTIRTMNLQEVQDHLSLTGHMVQALHISVGKTVWESLTADEQTLLEEGIAVGAEAAYDCVVEQEESIRAEFEAGDDIEVHEIDVTEFRDAVRAELSEGQPFSDLYRELIAAQEQ